MTSDALTSATPAWRRILSHSWAGVGVLVVFYVLLIVIFSVLSLPSS